MSSKWIIWRATPLSKPHPLFARGLLDGGHLHLGRLVNGHGAPAATEHGAFDQGGQRRHLRAAAGQSLRWGWGVGRWPQAQRSRVGQQQRKEQWFCCTKPYSQVADRRYVAMALANGRRQHSPLVFYFFSRELTGKITDRIPSVPPPTHRLPHTPAQRATRASWAGAGSAVVAKSAAQPVPAGGPTPGSQPSG